VRHISAVGGAEGVRKMIQEIADSAGDRDFDCTTNGRHGAAAHHDIPEAHHAYAIWTPQTLDRDPKSKEMVWRTSVRMGYGQSPNRLHEAVDRHLEPAADDGPFDLIVLDDAGVVFRKAPNESKWHLPPPDHAPWILLKLADPVAESDLWRRLVPGAGAGKGYEDKLICQVSAGDLRREAALIRHGSSRERTLEDLRDALETPALAPLRRCRHPIITFNVDAALWLQPDEPAWFCFAAADAEGDFADRSDGGAVGYLTAMAGALGYGICQSDGKTLDLGEWIDAGLRAMRRLHRYGHGPVTDAPDAGPSGYPFRDLSEEIVAFKETANEKFGPKAWLEFNLSQFSGTVDLNGALHQVRDKVLAGLIPVVFWDEFDSQGPKWLQYLLAPMQDGRFQDGQVTHPVGRSVFVFAGGTAGRWAEFGEPNADQSESELSRLKAPDFKSRLDAHYDVSEPNPRLVRTADSASAAPYDRADPDDIASPTRCVAHSCRAGRCDWLRRMFSMSILTCCAQCCSRPKYRRGARSMEKLVKALCTNGGRPVQRSDLPPPAQLGLHVDAAHFDRLLGDGRDYEESSVIETMAANIHDAYRERERKAGREPDERFNKDFKALAEAEKQDNRAAARLADARRSGS
jgi:hypothetical protein